MPSPTTAISRLSPSAMIEPAIAVWRGSIADRLDERAIDLEHVDREARAGGEARRCRCRSRRRRSARRASLSSVRRAPTSSESRRNAVSVSSTTRRSGVSPMSRERRRDVVDEPGVGELRAREVDAHDELCGERVSRRARPPACAHASRSTQRPSGHDQPAVLGDRDELAGHQQPALGMLPAHQRLDARRGAASSQVDDRLVVQHAARPRAAPARRSALELEPLDHRDVHLGLEDLLLAAALGLRAVQGEVGVAQQVVGLVGADRDPDAGADHDLAALHREGLVHRLEDAVRGHRDGCVVGVLEQDDELVAAEARRGVAGAHAARAAASPPSRSSSSPAAWPRLSLTVLKCRGRRTGPRPASRCAPRAPAPARGGRAAARGWAGR